MVYSKLATFLIQTTAGRIEEQRLAKLLNNYKLHGSDLDKVLQCEYIRETLLAAIHRYSPVYSESACTVTEADNLWPLVKTICKQEAMRRAAKELQDPTRLINALFTVLDKKKFSRTWKGEEDPDRILTRKLLLNLVKTKKIVPEGLLLSGKFNSYAGQGHDSSKHVVRCRYEGNDVALKWRNAENSNANFKCVIKEALIWLDFEHDNIVPFLGLDNTLYSARSGFLPSMVSPWMEHGRITDLINTGIRVSPDRKLGYITSVADAITYMHSRDCVHGDIKGANVLIDDRFRVKITDFNLSNFSNASTFSSIPSEGNSIQWTSPELVGTKPFRATKKSDTFAFGSFIFEVYNDDQCHPPLHRYSAERATQKIRANALLSTDFIFPSNMPQVLRKVIRKCWWFDAASRPTVTSVFAVLQMIRADGLDNMREKTQRAVDKL